MAAALSVLSPVLAAKIWTLLTSSASSSPSSGVALCSVPPSPRVHTNTPINSCRPNSPRRIRLSLFIGLLRSLFVGDVAARGECHRLQPPAAQVGDQRHHGQAEDDDGVVDKLPAGPL